MYTNSVLYIYSTGSLLMCVREGRERGGGEFLGTARMKGDGRKWIYNTRKIRQITTA